jgi:undecaprenyl-diphosphatase
MVLALLVAAAAAPASAAGGPLGIDHRWNLGDHGIWARGDQKALQFATPLVVVAGALWEGDDSRFGHTWWQSVDSLAFGVVASEAMKRVFARERPATTDDPNRWFQGGGHRSFPSGEVMEITTAITPFVLEYGAEHPAVWALELLPVYDGIARIKSRAHWQTDVLASFAIGTGLGYYAHSRTSALSVGILPHGFTIGWKKRF